MKKLFYHCCLILIFSLSSFCLAENEKDPAATAEEKRALKSQKESYKKIRGCFNHYEKILKPKLLEQEQELRKELSKLKTRAEKLNKNTRPDFTDCL